MMSDHWKLVANVLGTPVPPEPVVKESPAKDFAASQAAVLQTTSGETAPDGLENAPEKRDPLADLVDRQPDLVVPGFVVPEPTPAPQKPAKRSAWDSLIGVLGLSPTDNDDHPPAGATEPEPITPARETDEYASKAQRGPARPPKRGFGTGLVDSNHEDLPAADDEADFAPVARSQEPRSQEPQAPRRKDSRPRREESRAPREESRAPREESRAPREDRDREPRESRPPREGRQPREDRPERSRRPDSRSESPSDRDRPRSGGRVRQEQPARGPSSRDSGGHPDDDVAIGFGDGIVDWDAEPLDDSMIADDDDSVGFDDAPPSRRPAVRDEDESRGRGRRGGSRQRGQTRDIRAESGRDDADRAEPVTRNRGTTDEDGGETELLGQGKPDLRSRSGRRGQRQQIGAGELESRPPRGDSPRRETPRSDSTRTNRPPASDPPSRSGSAEFDYDDLIDDDLDVALPADGDEPASDAPARPRRRRGRRGRGGADRTTSDRTSSDGTTSDRSSTDRSSTDERPPSRTSPDRAPRRDDDDDLEFSAEIEPELIEVVDDDLDEDIEVDEERVRRSRRRGRGRGGERGGERQSSETSGDSNDAPPSRESGETAAARGRNIPTWLDTVNLLVEPNIERHSRSGPPRPPQNRGGRR